MKLVRNSSTNPNSSIKTKLASRFLRAMKKLSNKNPSSSSSPSMADKYRRYHAIRAAAYASMASAVGPRKAWSRAILRKMKNRQKIHHRHNGVVINARRNPRNCGFNLGFGDQENDLRGLLPGGESMDFSRLLNETGNYIKCLRAQVQLMRKIVDYSSSR